MDVEVSASGFTREMEKDLEIGQGVDNEGGEEDEEQEGEDQEEEKEPCAHVDDQGMDEKEVEELRGKVEEMMKVEEHKCQSSKNTEENNKSISDLKPKDQGLNGTSLPGDDESEKSDKRDKSKKEEDLMSEKFILEVTNEERIDSLTKSESTDLVQKAICNSEDAGTIEPPRRVRYFSDARSVTSTASTIAPEVIKDRVKKSMESRVKRANGRRILVKGEASATTRSRRDNSATIKESGGVWGWN